MSGPASLSFSWSFADYWKLVIGDLAFMSSIKVERREKRACWQTCLHWPELCHVSCHLQESTEAFIASRAGWQWQWGLLLAVQQGYILSVIAGRLGDMMEGKAVGWNSEGYNYHYRLAVWDLENHNICESLKFHLFMILKVPFEVANSSWLDETTEVILSP